MSDYVIDTTAAIELMGKAMGYGTGVGEMILYRAVRRLKDELNNYLTGKKS